MIYCIDICKCYIYIYYIFLYIYVCIRKYMYKYISIIFNIAHLHITPKHVSSHLKRPDARGKRPFNRSCGTAATCKDDPKRWPKIQRSLTYFLRILGPAMMSSCHHLIILCNLCIALQTHPTEWSCPMMMQQFTHKTLLDNLSQAAEFSRPGRQHGASNATSINKPTSG